jgi:hypothetical protein
VAVAHDYYDTLFTPILTLLNSPIVPALDSNLLTRPLSVLGHKGKTRFVIIPVQKFIPEKRII